MVEMRVLGLTLDEQSKTPVVILRTKNGDAVLPILVGPTEAMAISLALDGESLPRPLTHDLLLLCLNAFRHDLVGVEITHCEEGVYYAVLVLHSQTSRLRIDCRPSDAIALALRAKAPILVSGAVMRRISAQKSAAQQEMPPAADAAIDMVRRAGAQKEVNALHSLLLREGGLPGDGDPDRDAKFKELLHALEPVSRLKM
ncbi:MAG: bifunctional nuclease family protein [Desulfovibrio sp.]|jgi:bifunctional DNase/RNase|nr:bifunctional nuclease family protein [Desulfovibrio sp.]